MAGFFRRARDYIEGLAPAPPLRPQSYSVRCPEGHRLSGMRTEGYQAIRCPTCGEGVFILPRSPFPESGPPARRSRPAPSSSRGAAWDHESVGVEEDGPIALTDPPETSGAVEGMSDEGEADLIQWVDEEDGPPVEAVRPYIPADPTEFAAAEIEDRRRRAADAAGPTESRPPASPGGRPARSKRAEPSPRPKGRRRDPRGAGAGMTEGADTTRPRATLGDWARARRNPLIFGSVVLLVLATISYRIYRSWRDDLPRVAELGRTEGLAALDAGKFDTARQLLSPARRAVNVLGSGYDQVAASAIRQGADEVEILANLAPNSLESMLEEASRADPGDWTRTFDTLYKGRSIIVEDQFREVPDPTGRGRYDLYYRIFRPGEGTKPPNVGRIDLGGLRILEGRIGRVDDYVIFGARLASFRYDLKSEEWVVGLVPDSGVIMTHRRALDAIGWPDPSERDPEPRRPE